MKTVYRKPRHPLATVKKEESITPRRLSNIIDKVQAFLIQKEKEGGLWENFGQSESGLLRDNFLNISDWGLVMNDKRYLIQQFEDWCMNYTGTQNTHR